MDKPSGSTVKPATPLKATVARIAPVASTPPASSFAASTGPAVIAQPPVPGSEAAGGHLHPVRSAPADPASMPSFDDVRRLFSDARDVVKSRYRDAYEVTDNRLHRSPWQGVAIAALAGIVLGMLAAR